MSDPSPADLADTPPLLPHKDPLPITIPSPFPSKKSRISKAKITSPVRPGTSGTELGLRTNRQNAQVNYQRAQRAEAAYRARRQANNARKDIEAAKEHLGEMKGQIGGMGRSLKAGVLCGWKAVRAGPAVLRERRERNRVESAEKEKLLWEEKAKKAAAKAKREEGDDSAAVVAGEGAGPVAGEEEQGEEKEDAEAMLKRLEALKE